MSETSEDYGIFEPRIQDFGDNYHLSDAEVYSEASQAVRNVRRKYRNYADYIEAVSIVNEYFEELKEKYGGEKEFKLALELGFVKDFLPPIPKYRKTQWNELQSQAKCIVSEQDESKMCFDIIDGFEERIDNTSNADCGGFDLEENPTGYFPFDLSKTNVKDHNDEQTIADELELLQRYSESEEYRAAQSGKKHKKSSRNLYKEAKRRKKLMEKANRPKTVGELIDRYAAECAGIVEDEPDYTVYRGVIVPREDLVTMKVTDLMKKAGLMPSKSKAHVDSKQLRRMIKNDEKKHKKKKHEVTEEDMDEFVNGYTESEEFGSNYANFKAFEKEMRAFDSDAMERGIDW